MTRESTDAPLRTVWGVGTLRTFRVHWALRELELPYDTRPVQSRSGETQTPEFLGRVNGRGKIPVLVEDGTPIAESGAILSYLADRYGDPERFCAPAPGTLERALHDQWCFFAATELDATSLYILRRHVDLHAIYGKAPEACKSAVAYYERQVRVASEALSDGRAYLHGNTLSPADILLTSVLDWAEYCDIEVDDTLSGYRASHRARPAYAAAKECNRVPS